MVAGETDWQQKISEVSESLSRNQAMTTKDNDGLIRAAKDITAGSVGGIAQVLTGQPFDIVKVHPLCPSFNSRSVYKPNLPPDHGSIPAPSIV
jgi:hypothetical protein